MSEYWTPVRIRVTDVARADYGKQYQALRDENGNFLVEGLVEGGEDPISVFRWEAEILEEGQ